MFVFARWRKPRRGKSSSAPGATNIGGARAFCAPSPLISPALRDLALERQRLCDRSGAAVPPRVKADLEPAGRDRAVLSSAAAQCLLGGAPALGRCAAGVSPRQCPAARDLGLPGGRVPAALVHPRRLAGRRAFALHPVCVESVAWIAEQKNTPLVFYLLAALAYQKFEKISGGTRCPQCGACPASVVARALGTTRSTYLLATLLVMALLTKSGTGHAARGLAGPGLWRRGTLSWKRDVGPLLPWFALSAGSGLALSVGRAYVGAVGAAFGLTASQRFLVAGRAVWFYLGKLCLAGALDFHLSALDGGLGRARAGFFCPPRWRSRLACG